MRNIGTIIARKAGLKCTWCNFELQKRKRFCQFIIVCTIILHFQASKTTSVFFASLSKFVQTWCVFEHQKCKRFCQFMSVCTNILPFQASKTTSGFCQRNEVSSLYDV